MKIVATLLARDEEDIIEKNIRHHISEGIDTFIFTDNGSIDNTRNIAIQFPEVKVIIDEPGKDHQQSKWVTRMARIACEFNPDWIIHLDADELWCNLKSLHDVKEDVVVVNNFLYHLPVENWNYCVNGDFSGKIGIPPSFPKMLHRPNRKVIVADGNHDCSIRGERHYSQKIVIRHYPIRSYEGFLKKATYFAEAIKGQNVGVHWKNWNRMYLNGKLDEEWDYIVSRSYQVIKTGKAMRWSKNVIF